MRRCVSWLVLFVSLNRRELSLLRLEWCLGVPLTVARPLFGRREQLRGALQQLPVPSADLNSMHPELA